MRSRTTLALFLTTALALAGCGGDSEAAETTQTSDWSVACPVISESVEAADFADMTLPCLGTDNDYTIGMTGDQPLVLTLWATWCAPCVAEAPALQELHEKLGDKLTVVGVNTQDNQDKAKFFAEDFGWTFPSVFDERGLVLRSQNLVSLPAIFMIDAEGETVATLTEADLDAQDLLDAAEEHFGLAP